MPRTQCRNRHVPDGLSPRTGTGWAAQAPNAGRVRPSTGARCGHRRCSEAKSRTPGSVRGAGGNSRSYRDQRRWMHPWSLLRSWLRPHRGIAQEKLPAYLGFFQFIHNARQRGKALLGALIAALVTCPP